MLADRVRMSSRPSATSLMIYKDGNFVVDYFRMQDYSSVYATSTMSFHNDYFYIDVSTTWDYYYGIGVLITEDIDWDRYTGIEIELEVESGYLGEFIIGLVDNDIEDSYPSFPTPDYWSRVRNTNGRETFFVDINHEDIDNFPDKLLHFAGIASDIGGYGAATVKAKVYSIKLV